MPDRKLGLEDAYSVKTPDDNRALYRDWADTYEAEYTHSHGYVYHQGVASVFMEHRVDQDSTNAPVLDVGCGTGIVGVALHDLGVRTLDGIDLSPEMLEQAAAKGIYRTLTEADLTKPLTLGEGSYSGIVSAGTFTHGHLGPEPLRALADIAAPGALFAIGINAEHFAARGFESLLTAMGDEGLISPVTIASIPMYSGDGAADHARDLANVAVYRRL